MRTGFRLQHVGLAWLLMVLSVASLAMGQPNLERDIKQCTDAKTPTQCRAALPTCERVIESLAKTLEVPKRDEHYRTSLNVAGVCAFQVGSYDKAQRYIRTVLEFDRTLHGAEHKDIAESLHNLAGVLQRQGKYEAAETLYRQALAMRQKLLGVEHPDVTDSINDLAVLLEVTGKYKAAETLHRQALVSRQKLFGTEHPDVAQSMDSLAGVLDSQGKYEAAEALHRQALAMRQKLLGVEHPDVAASMNNLASTFNGQGKYEAAEMMYRQSLAIWQKMLGAEHPHIVVSQNNLADSLFRQGKYEAAEMVYRQALLMAQNRLGAEHPHVATILHNLAGMLSRQGKHEVAERMLRQALAMRKTQLGAEHPNTAQSLNSLAGVLSGQKKFAEAESLYRQALAIQQKQLGVEHPRVAQCIHNLGFVLFRQGEHAAAETLLRQALAMRRKLLGSVHPDIETTLNNLGLVLISQGKYEAAETNFREALAMRRKLLGSVHPDIATTLNNLAGVLISRGQFPEALPLYAQAAQIQETVLRATTSESRMRMALSQLRGAEDALYGLVIEHADDDNLKQLVMTTAILRKGRAAAAGTTTNRLLHQNAGNSHTMDKFEKWQQVRQQRESLLFGDVGKLSPDAYRERLKELSLQADELEGQLAMVLPQLRQYQLPEFGETLSAVTARLPNDGVLVEVLRVAPFNFLAIGTEERRKIPHYVALVVTADRPIAAHDLGEAAPVDGQVQELLSALRDPASNPVKSANALYEKVLGPVLPASAKHVYLSLDGALNMVPFDALHDGTDYLLGRKSFHYLTSGRDLLRTDSMEAKQGALLLADPDFGKAAQVQGASETETFYRRLSQLIRLPGAQEEAKQIGPLLHVAPIVGPAAKESVVRAAHGPWVLHIASHGLFITGRDLPRTGGRGGALLGSPFGSQFAERKGVLFGDFGSDAIGMRGDTDSLSRSALVLADAAKGESAQSAAEDGLLTAEEARSLDLFGTQLVVLSACDTGQGELSVGQGVYGLRRAFLVAGAETLVTSLWQVSDSATGKLMEKYYQKLLKEKKGRLEGMQEAMKEMRNTYKHPYYWAPFLVIGSDGPLRPPVSLSQL